MRIHYFPKFTVLFLILTSALVSAAPIKVAVLGDSITWGAGAKVREQNRYSTRLGQLLGDAYNTQTFAASSLCMLRKADKPFASTEHFKDAIGFKPDIAFILLGTNDTCQNDNRKNWQHHADLKKDARFLISQLQKANPKVIVHLCSPTPMFPKQRGLKPDRKNDLTARAKRLPIIVKAYAAVAQKSPQVHFHDLSSALPANKSADGVHPNTFGHEELAYAMLEFIHPDSNPAAIPEPSSEYRGGAGWGSTWGQAFDHLKAEVKAHPDTQLVFLGDSITQGLTGHKNRATNPKGNRAIDRYFGKEKAISLGLSGDRTEHLLWRLGHSQLDGIHPSHLVLMIGVNNLNRGHSGAQIAEGTKAIVAWFKSNRPEIKILLLGSFPTGRKASLPVRAEVNTLHRLIKPLADNKTIFYQDLRPLFLKEDGGLNNLMRGDAIHINGRGQEAWMKAVQDFVKK